MRKGVGKKKEEPEFLKYFLIDHLATFLGRTNQATSSVLIVIKLAQLYQYEYLPV